MAQADQLKRMADAIVILNEQMRRMAIKLDRVERRIRQVADRKENPPIVVVRRRPATSVEQPKESKRAIHRKKPMQGQRATTDQKPKTKQRAIVGKKPKVSERAS